MPAHPPPPAPSWGLVLVRVAVGGVLLKVGWAKVSGGIDPQIVTGTRDAFAAAPAFVRTWGESMVLPNAVAFAFLIAWGELLGGLALFLGALTRPAGLLLSFMFLNFYLVGPPDARLFVLVLCACCLGCAISRAGHRAGVDVFLDERAPRWVTW